MPTFTDAQGIRVTYYVWQAEKARAVIQLAHGVGEYAQRYAGLAAALTAAGYTVYANDHRGHGQTGLEQWNGDHAALGTLGPGGQRAAIEDLRELTRIIRADNPGLPLVLLGHSWGSLLAQILLNAHAADYDGAVLTGSAYRMPGWMDSGDLNRKHAVPGGNGQEWLSRDVAVQEAAAVDPLMFDARVLKLFGLADALRLLGRPARGLPQRLPLLLMSGGDDTLGGERSIRRLAREYRARSGLTDISVRVYPGARHEVFQETNKDEVIADLVGWLDARFPATPPEPGTTQPLPPDTAG